jgi:uncharacterized membrane protein
MNIQVSAELIGSTVAVLGLAGSIIAVWIKMNSRIIVLETKLEAKIELSAFLEKLDEFRISIEKKIESEISKLSR